MDPYNTRVLKSYIVYNQDAWFSGIDKSMSTLGSARAVTSDDLIREQNAAIRDCWVVTGNRVRQAMLAVSDSKKVYPDELKGDNLCRKMLKAKNAGV